MRNPLKDQQSAASHGNTEVKEMSNPKTTPMKSAKLYIGTKEFMHLHNVKESTARKYLAKLRKEMGIPPGKPVTVRIYCMYYGCEMEDVLQNMR